MVYYCFLIFVLTTSAQQKMIFLWTKERLAEIWWFNPFRLLWTGSGEEPVLGLHPKPGCSQIWLLHVYIIVYIIVYLYINNLYIYINTVDNTMFDLAILSHLFLGFLMFIIKQRSSQTQGQQRTQWFIKEPLLNFLRIWIYPHHVCSILLGAGIYQRCGLLWVPIPRPTEGITSPSMVTLGVTVFWARFRTQGI